jgi:Arc/MetJ family transcription regulator
MRTTLDLDEKLIDEAKRISNGKSKKAVIEEALLEFINARRIEKLRRMIGSCEIDLTLEELRQMRGCDRASSSD